ncbi:MAG TPA: autotransporter assembly complex family protein [Rhizobiaceae bacterium]|nr:autotransporter assembly complex family protein [Rhizobiaceae bacterium]
MKVVRIVVCVSLLQLAAGAFARPASAFELFGFKLWGADEAEDDATIVNPIRYELTFEPATGDRALDDALKSASLMLAEKARPVSGSLGLLTKARNERELLVAALYGEARYDGVVNITIEGVPLDDIPIDAVFDTSRPVPVAIRVDPGEVFTLGNVALRGDAAHLAPARYGLLPGGEAGSNVILKAETDIVTALKEEGRPLARIAGREVVADHATRTLDVTLNVSAGPVAPYGRTSVEGTEAVDSDFVAYMTGLPAGRTYSPKEIEEARERLLALEVFSSVSVREAEALDGSGAIPMNVQVSERKHRYLGAGATFSSTEGVGLEGYWGHRNLFGRAEKLRIEGSISRIGSGLKRLSYNAGIMFEKPGVLGPASKFTSSLKGGVEFPDAYEKRFVDARAGFSYDITRRQTLSGEVRVEWSRVTDILNPVPKSHLLVSIPVQYVFDARDNRLDPKNGYRLLAYGEPTYDALTGAAFFKARGEASAYKGFGERFVLAGRLAAGSIVGSSLADIPADRRFYAGGGGSVRGYAYQGIGPHLGGKPTGGKSYAEASVEMRIQVTDTIGIVPFLDAGTVSTGSVPDFSDIRLGAGLGLRYKTPFGPLRIDAGVPLDRRPGDPSFGIYAGIGQAF